MTPHVKKVQVLFTWTNRDAGQSTALNMLDVGLVFLD